MADLRVKTTPIREPRIAQLTEFYRSVLARYQEIEKLSREERCLLSDRKPMAEVNEVLQSKRRILQGIRDEEARMTGVRVWWKKNRTCLPPAKCRDLLSLLDAISRTIERTLALESECRALLRAALSWKGAGLASAPAVANVPAALAYARASAARREP